jgi:hypothetical protein
MILLLCFGGISIPKDDADLNPSSKFCDNLLIFFTIQERNMNDFSLSSMNGACLAFPILYRNPVLCYTIADKARKAGDQT